MDLDWHVQSAEEVCKTLHTSKHGLSTEHAKKRLKKFGFNKIESQKDFSLSKLFFRQFINPLILILLAASLIKFALFHFIDGAVLMATIFIMAVIGFFQEAKAERAMKALKQLNAHKSKVRRSGKIEIISSEELVPGDEILLEMGDIVPADGRLIETKNLKINQSMLNGESMPSEKQPNVLQADCPLSDRDNMVYSGTIVAYGKGSAIIVATGMLTELGKIATSIQEIKHEQTPIQKSIHSIGNWMLIVVGFAILIFVMISLYKGMDIMDVFLIAVAAAVSAIPEGLPAAFTITLATGMSFMAKKNAIIRKLVAVETLGATTIICSDKTGTLTLNEMRTAVLYSFEKKINLGRDSDDIKNDPIFKKILEIGTLCNDALISKEQDTYEMIGDPTEGALLITALETGLDQNLLAANYPRIGEIPFLSENLYMATFHSSKEGQLVYVKGAPEKIISMSSSILTHTGLVPFNEKIHLELKTAIESMTKDALRLIAVAYCEIDTPVQGLSETLFKGKLILAGIFGLIDPPRKQAIEAIKHCKSAGIQVCMVTGDNQSTASAIAEKLGMTTQGILTGKEIENLKDEELKDLVKTTSIFARVEPSHKLRIVRAYQASGHIVAMTGDGVNDAPALEAANIGIAMGKKGTDVAKEAADMILSDDRFDTIVSAIEEGRAIFNRLRNICAFLLTACIGELIGLILCVAYTGLAPLLPVQIIWVNLVSGSVVAIPLGFEPKTGNEMKHPPRSPQIGIVHRRMVYRMGFLALLLGLGTFSIFQATYMTSLEDARTMVLCSLVVFEWLIALNMRSDELSVRKAGIWNNKPLFISIGVNLALHLSIMYVPILRELFHTVPLSLEQWGWALLPGAAIFLIESIRKELFPTLFSEKH